MTVLDGRFENKIVSGRPRTALSDWVMDKEPDRTTKKLRIQHKTENICAIGSMDLPEGRTLKKNISLNDINIKISLRSKSSSIIIQISDYLQCSYTHNNTDQTINSYPEFTVDTMLRVHESHSIKDWV